MAKKDFTTDWLTAFESKWHNILQDLVGGGQYLEVGAYEGRSACFIAASYPLAELTVVDNFVDNYNEGFEKRYLNNTAEYRDRITTIKGDSKDVLPRLLLKRQHYDVIYIDGAHDYETVKRDLEYCWKMLRPGGTLLMDDYNDTLRDNPFKFGVDQAVHEFFRDRVDFTVLSDVDTDYQFYVRKNG